MLGNGDIGERETVSGMRFSVVREIEDGARWAGVAVVSGEGDGWRVVEEGVWRFTDGREVRGTQEMVLGRGGVAVTTGFEMHAYALVDEVPEGWEFAAAYGCGADVYRVWGEWPHEQGWRLRMAVQGPNKDELQLVTYTKG